MVRFAALIAILLLAPLALADARSAPAAKLLVPDTAAQQKGSKEIAEVFGDQLAKAQTPDAKRALAVQFLSTADQTKDDPVSRYLLLQKVVDLSEQAGDATHMMEAMDRIQVGWQVDALEIKRQGMLKVSRTLTRPQDRKRFIGFSQTLALWAESDERFEIAGEFDAMGLTAAQAAGDADKAKEITLFSAGVNERAAAYAATLAARATLKTKPDDPQANLIVGKYECFMKGDWDNGLPKLARGGDATLTALIAKDRAGAAADAEAQYALGQGWWQLSDEQHGPTAIQQIRRRAAGWYQLAMPRLAGLELTQARTHMSELTAAGLTPLALASRQAGTTGENPPTTAPAAVAPGGGIVVVNYTDAKEAADVIASVVKKYSTELQGVSEADLVKYYNGSDLRRNGGELTAIADSYSATPAQKRGGGIFLWGPFEKRGPGKYLVVYRVQLISKPNPTPACFLDICSNGKTFARRSPKDSEFESGQWADMPILVDLNKTRELEYRLWPFSHTIALDRVYIFELP